MPKSLLFELADEAATAAFGLRLAQVLGPGMLLLQGELGAGKTCLARGILRGLGHLGRVKSPTYTLVEPYALTRIPVRHWDLYRIADPDELDALGLREYDPTRELMLIEWPERAAERLQHFDLAIQLRYCGDARTAAVEPGSERGVAWLEQLIKDD